MKNNVYTEAEVLAILSKISTNLWEEGRKTGKEQDTTNAKHTIDLIVRLEEYRFQLYLNVMKGKHPEFHHPQEIEELYN